MNKSIQQLIFAGLVSALVSGCASAPSRFYTLNATATAGSVTNADCVVIVGPVTIPAEVNRPQFTVQVAPNQVAVDEFNRWAGPLSENVARVVANDLSALLGTPRVATAPLANFADAFRVTISVQRFESVPGKSALIDAVWVVRAPSGGATQSGRTVATETVAGDTFDALAAAHSRALAKISGDIAAAVSALHDQKLAQ